MARPNPARPVRALFLSSCVRGGGAGWSLYYLLKHIDRSAIEPIVVVPNPGIFGERYDALGIRVVSCDVLPERTAQQRFESANQLTATLSYGLNLLDSARAARWLADFARREAVDLFYCNNMMVKPIGASAAQLSGRPAILHIRNLHESPARVLLYCRMVARLPAVRRLISNSSASAVPYRASVPDKVVVVYNGVDLSEYDRASFQGGGYRSDHGLASDDLVIGYTGNLIERKGLIPLIKAAALVCDEPGRDKVRFVAVGRVPIGADASYFNQCEALVERLGLGDRFRFTGFVPDVRPAVVDFDVLTLPSLQEPFGRSIIEAMALGVPVVASRVGGIPEIIEHDVNGLLAPAGDAAALARQLGRLVDDAALRARIGAAGRQRVEDAFDVARLTKLIEGHLLEVAGAG